MNIYAKVIKHSICHTLTNLVTLEISLPKVLLAEFNTHRVFSRNFSSSRAIPTARNKELDLFIPRKLLKNKAGMQAMDEEVDDSEEAMKIWNDTIEYCKNASAKLAELKVHKQWANRPMDWCVMAKGIVTSTSWANFFMLRNHPDAQPEMRELAIAMEEAISTSSAQYLFPGEWHLPYIENDELKELQKSYSNYDIAKFSAARVCRVSYNNMNGRPPSVEDDFNTFEKLYNSTPQHLSPMESPCLCYSVPSRIPSNIKGWSTLRQIMESKRAPIDSANGSEESVSEMLLQQR